MYRLCKRRGSPTESGSDGLNTNTIFQTLSLDRSQIHWEEHLLELTPLEEVDGVWFKREDYFSPLGYGGINGSKLRQCIYLVDGYVRTAPRPKGIVSGASVKSPQLPMSTAVASHYGLSTICVIGATYFPRAMENENVAMAQKFGAEFDIIKVAYNPALQRRVRELAARDPDLFLLEYGISLDHYKNSPAAVEAFHRIGAEQVQNLPDQMENLVIPTGSGNSAVSILYGLTLFPPKNLHKVYLIGIGPPKIDWIYERLALIVKASWRMPLMDFSHDLHTSRYASYSDEIRWNYGGIDFHPTYEGKVMKYLEEKLPQLLRSDGKTCVWVVGSRPSWIAMEKVLEPCRI